MGRKVVTVDDYDRYSSELDALANDNIARKRPEYTHDSVNALENFDSIADRLGSTPAHVICTYRMKHDDAIVSNLLHGIANSEPMDQRFADSLNYLRLLYADYRRGKESNGT